MSVSPRVVSLVLPALAAFLLVSCGSSKPEDLPTAEARFRLGMNEYIDEDYFDALQHFEIIRLQFPGSTVSDSARYYSGMSRYFREEYLLGSYEFSQMIQNHPSSPLVPDAQYMYAECFYQSSPKYPLDQTYTTRAIDALQTFIELYPRHEKVSEAERQIHELTNKLAEKEYKTGVLYTKLENLSSALIYFDGVIDKYYNTEFADDAMLGKIRILVRRKQFVAAKAVCASFIDKYADSPLRQEVVSLQETAERGLKEAAAANSSEQK
jgi:outer membrane protein assembly factor BamD